MSDDEEGGVPEDAGGYGESSSRIILRLPVDVVNRIAAGEIIHRPANALKEMMENSLDAGATMIRVQLKEGGLKMLQIQDDGCGVSLSDMPLLCERFATSKLRSFGDLSRMTTFGFRGEALASISYVTAAMTVISRTSDSDVAYKASYSSGKLVPSKPGQDGSPKACAGSQGTFITAEDLFYNVPQRKRALRSANDEYNLALDVISKYAVHYGARGIGFSCKKANSSSVDLSVPASSQMSSQDVIGLVYGNRVAKELMHLPSMRDDALRVSVQGWISGPNWTQARKAMFLLFINNRLVDSPSLRRAVTAVYATMLPKGAHPWIYLSLHIDEENVDVNVHPTKREVHFMHEEAVIDRVCSHVQDTLASVDAGRKFSTTQTLLRPLPEFEHSASSSSRAGSGYPQHTIRVDARARTLDAMVGFTGSSDAVVEETPTDEKPISSEGAASSTQTWLPQSETDLESIHELREVVQMTRSEEAERILRDHALVGVVEGADKLVLLQHDTRLYAVDYAAVMEEVAYQMLLRRFGQHSAITLDPPPLLAELIRITLTIEEERLKREYQGISHDRAVKRVCNTLVAHREMLSEYFSIQIDRPDKSIDARLIALPDITEQMPRGRAGGGLLQPDRLPALIVRLVTQVDYTSEKQCLQTILRELALAHVPHSVGQDEEAAAQAVRQDWLQVWQPAMRIFHAGKSLLSEGTIRSLASLPSLYNIFERC